MRNLTLLIVLAVNSLSLQSSAFANPQADKWPKITWKYEYYAGAPDKRGVCIGTGTCRIVFDFDITWELIAPGNGDGSQVKDVVITRNSTGALVFEFAKSTMTTQEVNTMFDGTNNVFHLATESMLPEDIVSLLQLRADYKIEPGSYRVNETQTHYLVTLNN